jgi:hypothetical protein
MATVLPRNSSPLEATRPDHETHEVQATYTVTLT